MQNILYVLCDQGNQALQSEICSISGISRQTINSALSKLEQQGLVRVEPDKGRNTMVFLTEEGQKFAAEKVAPLFQIENKIWSEWTAAEQQQYLELTQKYRDSLKKKLKELL